MSITKGVHELADLKITNLGDHVREQRVACDVKRHAQENVGTALIELAGQLPVGHIKLEHGMTRWQGHLVDLIHFPGIDDQATGIRIGTDELDELGDLIVSLTIRALPAAPLRTVDRAEVAVFVRPFIPDGDVVVMQILDVGFAPQKPEQFDEHRPGVDFFGGQQREAFGQVEAHLVAEDGSGPGAGAVGFVHAMVQDILQEIKVGLHVTSLNKRLAGTS